MEKESFENTDVADILNKYFVAIKVDREERPDIDSIYMTVCQAMSGSGGLPMTIIMTPDKKPFFAGTYFPRTRKYGRAGLIEILSEIKDAWGKRREELIESGNRIADFIGSSRIPEKGRLEEKIIAGAYEEYESLFDDEYGGFGTEPKFPTPHNLSFLLRYGYLSGIGEAMKIVEKTLESMYKGGIFDHVGFGFSRYSTDRRWLVPHFEKMLYDNALLITAYTEAYQLTGRNLYRETAEKIISYVLRDMTSGEGAFFTAEDADSEGVEGKFYLWTPEEVKEVLGNEDADIYCKYYNITGKGNFEGKSIPNLIKMNLKEIEEDEGLKKRLDGLRLKLFEHREKRVRPFKDDKILASWNGLMIAALSYAGRVFGKQEYIESAKIAAGFLLEKLVNSEGRLISTYRDGAQGPPGFLEDYAFLTYGLIELYEASFEAEYLKKAAQLSREMVRLFWDSEHGGLFLYGNDSEVMIARPKEAYDGAIPSGNSVAAYNLLRLASFTGDKELADKAREIFEAFGKSVEESPNGHSFLLMAYMYSTVPAMEIVIAGEKDDIAAKDMLYEINGRFLPFSNVVLNDGDKGLEGLVPFIEGKTKMEDKTAAYVCRNFSCTSPVTELDEFKKKLDE